MCRALSGNARELYARNLYNFIDAFYDKDTKQLTLDWEDEIIAGIALTRDGNIVHEGFVGTAKVAKDYSGAQTGQNESSSESS